MKLFQQLMLAPAALGLVAPMGAMAGELNFGGVSKYVSSDEQVTSISQFSDVYPTDWAYPVSYTHLTLPTKRIV